MSWELRVRSYGLGVTGYGLGVTGYGLNCCIVNWLIGDRYSFAEKRRDGSGKPGEALCFGYVPYLQRTARTNAYYCLLLNAKKIVAPH